MERRESYSILIKLLKGAATDNFKSRALSVDEWRTVVDQSLEHGIGSLLYERLNNMSGVPAETIQRLKMVQLATGLKNAKLYTQLAGVLNAFAKDAIPVIVLKGAHLAELVYSNVSERTMDDIDLLVKESDLSRVETHLFDLGYFHLKTDAEKMMSVSPHHLTPFRKEGAVPIEVHWTLPSMNSFGTDASEIWQRAPRVEIAGSKAQVLSPEDLLLHISAHASLHHRFGVGLRPFCDIAAILTRYKSEIDWGKLQDYARQWGLTNALHLTLCVAADLVNAQIPDHVLQAMMPADFDPTMVDWAKEQIYTRSTELVEMSSMSPRLARLWGEGSLFSKMKQLAEVLFPAREKIARTYGCSSHSLLTFLYYPVRWKDLIIMRGGAVLRLLRGDKDAIAKAELYRKLMSTPRQ
jgi:hypothetical protein